MGLFGSSESKACSICGREAKTGNGNVLTCNCGAFTHKECLKNSNNVKKESGLISSSIKVRCPNCNRVGEF